mgnify:CR=1 FL=1
MVADGVQRSYDHLLAAPARRRARGLGPGRTLALFTLFVVVETELASRFDLVSAEAATAVLLAALGFGVAGLLALLVAGGDIWRDGCDGAGHLAASVVVLALGLSPFVAGAAAALVFPPVAAVTTDRADPPAIPGLASGLFAVSGEGGDAAPPYPDLIGRRYPLSTVELFTAARAAATGLGWTVLREAEPADEETAGRIGLAARDLPFAPAGSLALRIRPAPGGARIDVSAAVTDLPVDLGLGAFRIRRFFATLDDQIRRSAEE